MCGEPTEQRGQLSFSLPPELLISAGHMSDMLGVRRVCVRNGNRQAVKMKARGASITLSGAFKAQM